MHQQSYLEKIPLTVTQSIREEIANGFTHGLGAMASLIALIVLLVITVKQGDISKIWAFAIYGVSLTMLYTFSALYHSVRHTKAKKLLRICDHISIYLLIAGSYTPISMLVMNDFWGQTLLITAWTMAFLGIIYEIFFLGKHKIIGVSLYLIMGWVAVFAIKPIIETMALAAIIWLFIGGLCYSLGVVFYLAKKMPFHHAIWHCFVLGGSAAHFICFYKVGFSL